MNLNFNCPVDDPVTCETAQCDEHEWCIEESDGPKVSLQRIKNPWTAIFNHPDFDIESSVNVETMISMTIGTEKVSVRK